MVAVLTDEGCSGVNDIAWLGSHVVTASDDRALRVWSCETVRQHHSHGVAV
jgi:WD40 repeat protein